MISDQFLVVIYMKIIPDSNTLENQGNTNPNRLYVDQDKSFYVYLRKSRFSYIIKLLFE